MLQTRYYFEKEFIQFYPILSNYPYHLKRYHKGDYLVKAGDLFDFNHYLLSGLIKVSVLHESGDDKIIAYFGPHSIYPIIANEKPFILESSILVQALSDVETMAFSFATTREIMCEHPEISMAMIDHYCKFTNYLFFQETTQTYEPLITRVCNMLYIYLENFHSPHFDLTQSDLASSIGATRAAVVKVLKKLRDEKIIQTSRTQITITDKDKLIHYCSVLTIKE